MNTLLHQHESPPLRRGLLYRAFLLDAIATSGMGLALVVGAEPLAAWFGLPTALLRGGGLVCVAFAAYLVFAFTRERITRPMALFVIGVNAAWVLASFGLLASGWVRPTMLGTAFVIAQALTVAVFGELQYVGMKRAKPS